jgi:hypothetical protein
MDPMVSASTLKGLIWGKEDWEGVQGIGEGVGGNQDSVYARLGREGTWRPSDTSFAWFLTSKQERAVLTAAMYDTFTTPT